MVHNDHHYVTPVNIAKINLFITQIIYHAIKLPELATTDVRQDGGVSRQTKKTGSRDIFEICLSQDIAVLRISSLV